jgi:hypothetical protein
MAIPSNAFSSYSVGYPYSASGVSASVIGTREDAMNTLTMIDPDEAMSLAVLAKTTTNGLRHEWFIDTLQATSTAGAIQGDEWGSSSPVNNVKTLKARTRLWNSVQWFRQDWSITTDELMLSQRGQIFGVSDELSYQTGKASQEVNRNIDARLWALGVSTYGSNIGDDSTAPRMATFRYFANASGVSATASSIPFSTAQFYALHENMWSAGAKPDTLFVSPGVKSDISRILLGDVGYPTTVNGNAGIPAVQSANVVQGGEYGPVIDFIRTDFGRVAMVVDRWIPQQTVTANATAHTENAAYFLVEKAKLRVAWWRPIKPYQVATTGDNVKVYVLGACTTEVLHPTAIGHVAGITT